MTTNRLQKWLHELPLTGMFAFTGFLLVSTLTGSQGCARNNSKWCDFTLTNSYDWVAGAPDDLPEAHRKGTVTVADGKVTLVSQDGAVEAVWTIQKKGWSDELW